jgi:ParB family chromosome partitioning protein
VVRRTVTGYELIAGERRLRAALLAGIREVPCLVRESTADESAELAIIENLQRRDLDMFEEAVALAALAARYGMTQEEIGRRLSVSQSYVANKLRLLRLSDEAQAIVIKGKLTERHARAVLRLPEEKRIPALRRMAEEGMNVASAERYVERLLSEKKRISRHTGVIKDIRLFYNSIDRAMRLVKESGIGIRSERHESDDTIEVIIRINKKTGA